MAGGGWHRREMLEAAALVALALGLPTAGVVLSGVGEEDAPTDRQRLTMRLVADHVIPATDTPGAAAANVGDFVILALAHGLDGTRAPAASAAMAWALPAQRRRDGSLRYVDWLVGTLDRASNGDWAGRPAGTRHGILSALDARAYAAGADDHPWRKLKSLILTGYYTSEAGGAQELRYELDPGRYDPRVPLAPGDRAFSSDWTAVDFG